MSYCLKCGATVEESSGYCGNCGATLTTPLKPQNDYQQPTYQQPMMSNELPRASIVLGWISFGFGLATLISGVTFGWILLYGVMFVVSFGLPGIICGAIAKNKANEVNMTNPKAKSGIVMSIIGISISVIEMIIFVLLLADTWSNYNLY